MSIKDLAEMIDIGFGISLTLGGILWICLYLKLDKIYDELKEIRKGKKEDAEQGKANDKQNEIIADMLFADIDKAINNIKADLDEAEKLALEYSSGLIQAYQQGRIYAYKFALTQIERLRRKRMTEFTNYGMLGGLKEVKHGEWQEVKRWECSTHSVTDMKCSVCHHYSSQVLPHQTTCTYDYCPFCGANMRERRESE